MSYLPLHAFLAERDMARRAEEDPERTLTRGARLVGRPWQGLPARLADFWQSLFAGDRKIPGADASEG